MANLVWCLDIRDNSILSLSTRTLEVEENEPGNHMSHIYVESHMRDLRTELGHIYSVLKLIVIILYVTFKPCVAWR